MLFDEKSRYAKLTTYIVVDRRGRQVEVLPVPQKPEQSLLGIHVLKQGERLDHLATKYLSDAAGYWRIAERNDVMFPEALSEATLYTLDTQGNWVVVGRPREIEIPGK
jgi:hypothetical protein